MRECQRLHEKPSAARLLIRVTSYPSEHKRIDLRRIPDSCPFAYTEQAAPTRHPPTPPPPPPPQQWASALLLEATCAGRRNMQAGPPSTFSFPAATPLVGSPFDIHASAGRSAQWSLDPSRRFESKRESKAGSGEGSVAAKWQRPRKSQAFPGVCLDRSEHRDKSSRD